MDRTMNEIEKKAEVIGTLFAAYGASGDGHRIAIYTKALADMPLPALKAACNKLLLEMTRIPTIADIVAACRSLEDTAHPENRVNDWDQAWAEIVDNIKHCGLYGKLEWSRPEIKEAVENFGWRNLCGAMERDMPNNQARIRHMYEDICKRKSEKKRNLYILSTSEGKQLESAIKELATSKSF